MADVVAKFNEAWEHIRSTGKLSQVAQSVWGADMWVLNGWTAHLTDGGYGRAIIGPAHPKKDTPIFRAYNVYNVDGEQIVLTEGEEAMLENVLTSR